MLNTMANSTVWFKMLTNNVSSIPSPHMVVPFFWLLYIDNRNVKKVRGKEDIQQPRNFKYKVKHKIGCYPKCILIFTVHKVQGWWTILLSSVNFQPNGSNATEIMLNSLCHIDLKHSKLYTFIWQKSKKHPDGFCTHLFFASEIILLFGGLFYIVSPGYSN